MLQLAFRCNTTSKRACSALILIALLDPEELWMTRLLNAFTNGNLFLGAYCLELVQKGGFGVWRGYNPKLLDCCQSSFCKITVFVSCFGAWATGFSIGMHFHLAQEKYFFYFQGTE